MIFRNYILIFILSLSSTIVAQKLKITSPKEGEYWNLENMNKIEWEAQDLSGTLEIQYSETGKWNSWKKYKEVTIKEGDATFYEPSIDGGNEGYFFIRIIAKDTNLIDKVKIKLIVENWFLITKNDNIRKAPHQSRDRIKYCKFNERYKIIKKVGDWYKIELDLYPYYGFTHKTNGVVIKETALNRGISAYDYASPPNKSAHINKPTQNSGNSEGDVNYGCLFFSFIALFYLISE